MNRKKINRCLIIYNSRYIYRIISLWKNKSNRTHLVLSSMLHNLFIDNLIHDLETLDGLLLCDTNISLLQGHGTETTEKSRTAISNKEEQTNSCS